MSNLFSLAAPSPCVMESHIVAVHRRSHDGAPRSPRVRCSVAQFPKRGCQLRMEWARVEPFGFLGGGFSDPDRTSPASQDLPKATPAQHEGPWISELLRVHRGFGSPEAPQVPLTIQLIGPQPTTPRGAEAFYLGRTMPRLSRSCVLLPPMTGVGSG